VEEFFTTAERQLSNKIHQLTTQKLAETQAEINRMLEEEKFNDAERQAKAEALNKQLAQWDALRQDIQEIGNALQDMERNMAASLPR
jgi:phage-related protein